jgi:multimeric flavodoxin WrbA
VLKDDMDTLHDEILSADAIVLGSPVYMFQVTGQTKCFTDRLFALLNPDYTPRFRKGLPIVLVYAQTESSTETFRGYFDLVDKLFNDMGFSVAETMVAAGTVDRGDVAKQTEVMARAKEAGRKLAS